MKAFELTREAKQDLRKFAIFTDTDTPTKETVSASGGTKLGTYDYSGGTYLSTISGSSMFYVGYGNAGRDAFPDMNGIELEFTVPNYATSEKVIIEVKAQLYWYNRIDNDHTPKIMVWDDNSSTWRSTDLADERFGTGLIECSGIGGGDDSDSGYCKNFSGRHDFRVQLGPNNIQNYFNGSGVLKIRVRCGDVGDYPHVSKIRFAQLENTYDALFDDAAETIYTIDSYTATRLTFTGQTPQNDGIGDGDLYKVGELISTIVPDIWIKGKVDVLDLDFDVTTEVDAQDYSFGYIGGYLREFAQRLNRRLWHGMGWILKCKIKANLVATTGDAAAITEADMIADKNGKGWYLENDLLFVKGGVTVFGDGVERSVYPVRAFYNAYPSPLWILKTESSIHSEYKAFEMALRTYYYHRWPKRRLHFTIDKEAAGKDYSSMEVGKEIPSIVINPGGTSINISDGIIVQMDHFQTFKGHSKVTLIVEEDLSIG